MNEEDLFDQVFPTTTDGLFDNIEENDLVGENGNTGKNRAGGEFDDLFNDDAGGENIAATLEEQQLYELTLHQWVAGWKSKAQTNPGQESAYRKAALSIALMLTEHLLEAEQEEQAGNGNPVPLESIVAENVLIRVRGEEIEYVWILSLSMEEVTGSVTTRLFAMGKILYMLFACETNFSLEDGTLKQDTTVDKRYEDVKNGNQRPRKKSSQSQQTYSSMKIASLSSKGVPWSVRALLNSLLECGNNGYCGDDAYSSFFELKQDLGLMLADPSRFLEDIQVNNGLPTLKIRDQLYGRENEEAKLDRLYQQHINTNTFNGVIISGGAGIGKSHLAMNIQQLTSMANGYFCAAKFQQNNMQVKPLSTIGAIFNSLTEQFAEDAPSVQLKSVSDELVNALGNQAGLLAGVVTSLPKLMPLSIHLEETSNTCVDASSSMQYLFGELLRIISSHSMRPISLLIDDIQFADSSSLLLIGNLLFTAARCDLTVFFAFCHRDNDPDHDTGTFDFWLGSISMYALEEL